MELTLRASGFLFWNVVCGSPLENHGMECSSISMCRDQWVRPFFGGRTQPVPSSQSFRAAICVFESDETHTMYLPSEVQEKLQLYSFYLFNAKPRRVRT